MSLNKEFAEMVQEQNRSYRFIHPLISGMEFSPRLNRKNRWSSEFQLLQKKAREQAWQNMPPLLDQLHNPDTAIILTNAQQKIEWVNRGFCKMTGYTLEEVSGRNPKMLQGKETSGEHIEHLRQSIKKLQPFSAEILNYRKSGEAYFCQVAIFPLLNDQNILVNFIAIERETTLLAN
jgi:PAS domain S-box-containing protein